MAIPRKIWVRVVIYGAALSYFGYAAIQKSVVGADEQGRAFLEQVKIMVDHPPKYVTLPDGTSMPVFEMNEEEAAVMFGPGAVQEAALGNPKPSDAPTPPAPGHETPTPPAPAHAAPTEGADGP